LQSGAATTLLLAAIEGAPREELARLSRETAAGLRASQRFSFVGDGTLRLGEQEEALLFRHRYLLSPETRAEAFTAAALRPKLEALLDGLRSAAGPVLARLGFSDPTAPFSASRSAGWARPRARASRAPGSPPAAARAADSRAAGRGWMPGAAAR
jgi:predicted exporter